MFQYLLDSSPAFVCFISLLICPTMDYHNLSVIRFLFASKSSNQFHLILSLFIWTQWEFNASKPRALVSEDPTPALVMCSENILVFEVALWWHQWSWSLEEITRSINNPLWFCFLSLYEPSSNQYFLIPSIFSLRVIVIMHMCCNCWGKLERWHESLSSLAAISKPICESTSLQY